MRQLVFNLGTFELLLFSYLRWNNVCSLIVLYTHICRVYMNVTLLGNTIKFTKVEGVHVGLKMEERDDLLSSLVFVGDTGSGMIAEQITHIFCNTHRNNAT